MKVLNLLLTISILASTVTPALITANASTVLPSSLKPIKRVQRTVHNIAYDIIQYPLVGESVHNKPSSPKTGKNKRKKGIVKQTSSAFYPIEICIRNNSLEPLVLEPASIDLTLKDLGNVAKLMRKNTAVRNILLSTAITSGLIAGTIMGAGFFVSASLAGAVIFAGTCFTVLPALSLLSLFFILPILDIAVTFLTIILGIGICGLGLAIPLWFLYDYIQYYRNKKLLYSYALHEEWVIQPRETSQKNDFC